MDVATIKRYLENQIGDINKELKNIYLPHEAVLILLGKRTAFAMTLEFIDSLQQEQKPAEWSEDERIRKWLIDYFKNVGNTWIHREISSEQILSYLEKQKDHFRDDTKMVEQKPAEWSEEDKCHLASIIGCIELCNKNPEDAAAVFGYYDSDINWLKSLRPSWKPSEEELVALKRVGSILRDYGHSELAKTVFMIEGKLANFN